MNSSPQPGQVLDRPAFFVRSLAMRLLMGEAGCGNGWTAGGAETVGRGRICFRFFELEQALDDVINQQAGPLTPTLSNRREL